MLPTLPMFLALPAMLRAGMSFYVSMIVSTALTAVCYGVLLWLLRQTGVNLG